MPTSALPVSILYRGIRIEGVVTYHRDTDPEGPGPWIEAEIESLEIEDFQEFEDSSFGLSAKRAFFTWQGDIRSAMIEHARYSRDQPQPIR